MCVCGLSECVFMVHPVNLKRFQRFYNFYILRFLHLRFYIVVPVSVYWCIGVFVVGGSSERLRSVEC